MPAKRGKGVPPFIWVLLAVLAFVVVYRVAMPGRAGTHHPAPRAGITGDAVLPAQTFEAAPDVAAVYAAAREVPHVLDGIYCYCHCAQHSNHRSLLTCFESDHGALCDICLEQARLAWQMHREGRSLEEIRAQMDARYAG
jgi:hypothetical protein